MRFRLTRLRRGISCMRKQTPRQMYHPSRQMHKIIRQMHIVDKCTNLRIAARAVVDWVIGVYRYIYHKRCCYDNVDNSRNAEDEKTTRLPAFFFVCVCCFTT